MAQVPLTRGGFAIIDDADIGLLGDHKWFELRIGKTHRYVGTGRHSRILLHRVIMGAAAGQVVDHINGNGLDNRRENLRLCTRGQNLCNRRRAVSSQHAYKGIGQSRHKTRYYARIRFQGKRETIGWFDTAEEAAAAYDIAAVLRFGEFACLNFPHVFPEISQRSA